MLRREKTRLQQWYRTDEFGELRPRRQPAPRSRNDPAWMRIVLGLCVFAVLCALFVREYRRTHPAPESKPRHVVVLPKARPQPVPPAPAKPFDFFR